MKMHLINLKLFALIALTILTINSAASENIIKLIKNDANLTKFNEWIESDALVSVVLGISSCTVFAPTDEAFKKYLTATGKDSFDKNLAALHTTVLFVLPEFFPSKAPTFSSPSPSLFLLKKVVDRLTPYNQYVDIEYYVNNAKIIGKPKVIQLNKEHKQALYIIDEVITPFDRRSQPIPPTALEGISDATNYAKISNNNDLKKFEQQISKHKLEDLYKRAGFHTYLVPINIEDRFVNQIDESVLKAHIIPDQALFLRTFDTSKTYKSLSYDNKIKVEISLITKYMNDSINTVYHYLQSNVIYSGEQKQLGIVKVKIHKANVPVTNGVIHFIESPLMIIKDSIKDILRIEGPGKLSVFSSYVNKNEEMQTRLNGNLPTTILAPTDEAFKRVDHIMKNMTYNDLMNIIRLHLITDQSITSDNVRDIVKEYNSMSENKPVHFNSFVKDDQHHLTVEGDGVNATVIQADIGATNGIVHIIDKVLGVSVQTIKEKISSDQRLRTTYDVTELSSGNWNARLDNIDNKFTLFAPSSDAWEYMKNTMPSEYKQLTEGLYPRNAERILERHIVVSKILLADDLKENMEIETARGTIMIKRDALNRLIVKWENVEALITRSNVQSINGVIHEVNRVLMKKNDLAVSPALALNNNSKASSLMATLLLPILLYILAKLI